MLVIFFVFLVFDSIQPFKHIYSADKENKDYVSIGGIDDEEPPVAPPGGGTIVPATGPQVNIAGVPANAGDGGPLVPAPPPPKRTGGANRGLTRPGPAAPAAAKRRKPNRTLRRKPNRTLKQPGTSAKSTEGPKAAKGKQGNLESSSEDQNTMSSENTDKQTLVCRMILYLNSWMRFLIFLFENIWSNHLPCMR